MFLALQRDSTKFLSVRNLWSHEHPASLDKNVRYSTINDENKYKRKDHLFIHFQNNNSMVNKREK